MIVYSVVTFLSNNITYRIFLPLDVSTTSIILLSIYNIKILVLTVPLLNGSECTILRVIAFVLVDMSTMFIMGFSLFSVGRVSIDFTPTLMGPVLTFCCLETSFSSVSLSPKSSLDSFSDEEDSLEVLDSSSLKSSSSSPMVLSR